nr:2-hydroxyacylsphingosine 1-beta-galactosyltransferase-like [Halyomorpha halys]
MYLTGILSLAGTLLFASSRVVSSHRILAFLPFNGKTHHIIYRPILEALADAGHNITYVTPISPSEKHPKINYILIDDCYPGFNSKFFFENSKRTFYYLQVNAVYGITTAGLEKVYNQPNVKNLIESSETFDAVITETCFFQEANAALHHRFNAVGIEICCLGERSWINSVAGLPDNTAYMIDYRSPYTDNMNLLERIHNAYITLSISLSSLFYLHRMEQVAKRSLKYHGSEDRPPLDHILANISMILVNSHPALSYPYPTSPHVKKIAGVVINKKTKPLPEHLQNFLDNAEHGVIYMSLGTNLAIVSESTEFGDVASTFMKVFGNLKQRVVMKWDSDYPKDQVPANVIMSSWFPQQQILAHNRTKLFISHGGYSSLYESAYYGVPIIGIPYFGDQPKNILAAVVAGYCVRVNYDNVSEDSLTWAIKELLNNKRYKAEAERRSALLRDTRTSPVDDAVFWIEHSIKFPNALTPRSAYMSFVVLNLIDVKFILLIIIFSMYYVARRFIISNNLKVPTNKVKSS